MSHITTQWWRFDGYTINGGAIGPSPRASCRTYDPWRDYAVARRERKEAPPPYQPLLGFAHRLRRESGSGSDDAIVRWCSEHGLLGIFPAQAMLLTFGVPERIGDVSGAGVSTLQYVQMPSGWIKRVGGDIAEGIVLRTYAGELRVEPDLQAALSRYSLWSKGPVPLPLTPRFWARYTERVSDFVAAAAYFLEVIEEVARDQERGSDRKGAALLDALRGPAAMHLLHTDRGYTWTWSVPSLLSAYAAMAAEDLVAGRRVLRCARCETPFVSGQYNARFCTPSCRNVQLVHEHRLRQRAKQRRT